jgi:C1A family cysteine protease
MIFNVVKSIVDGKEVDTKKHLKGISKFPRTYRIPKIENYNQEDIGSCTANMSNLCFRTELKKDKYEDIDTSRLYSYYYSRMLDNSDVTVDSGATIKSAFKALNQFGVCKEKFWIYVTSKFAIEPNLIAKSNAKMQSVTKYATLSDASDLDKFKAVLSTNTAIGFGFQVYQSFMDGKWLGTTNIMPKPRKTEPCLGGHAVTIVGWDDLKKSFIVQNSWGTDWANSGDFYFPYKLMQDSNVAFDFWVIEDIAVNTEVKKLEEVNVVVKTSWFKKIINWFKNLL